MDVGMNEWTGEGNEWVMKRMYMWEWLIDWLNWVRGGATEWRSGWVCGLILWYYASTTCNSSWLGQISKILISRLVLQFIFMINSVTLLVEVMRNCPTPSLSHSLCKVPFILAQAQWFHSTLTLKSRDSSVGIALGYGLDDRESRVRFPAGVFLFTTASRASLGPTQPPIQWVLGALSLG
jgi:hypothetical protein